MNKPQQCMLLWLCKVCCTIDHTYYLGQHSKVMSHSYFVTGEKPLQKRFEVRTIQKFYCSLPKCRASGAVHLMGICLSPPDTVYSSSSRDIPKSEIFTSSWSPTRQFLAARSLQNKGMFLVPFHLWVYFFTGCQLNHIIMVASPIIFQWATQLIFYL